MNKAKAPQRRNYCRDLAIAAVKNIHRNGGSLNEDVLIANAFMIFFVNYFCDTYAHEALDALKHSKHYRYHVKQLTDNAMKLLQQLDSKLNTSFGQYTNVMAQVNLDISEAFEPRMQSLRDSVADVIQQNTDQDVVVKTRMALALMLLEFSTQNFKDRIEEAKPMNPIIEKLKFIDHKKLLKLMTDIFEMIGVPSTILRDLTIMDKFRRIQTDWLSPEFIAAHIQAINGITDEEVEELKDTIRSRGEKTR